MNVILLSSYEADKLLIWCQKCCTWSWYDQMHWRLNVMSDMLHSAVKRSDARWRLSVDADQLLLIMRQNVMSDDCTRCWCIKCTGGWKWCQYCCIWCWNHQMHWRNCLIVRTASDVDVIRCTDSCFDVSTLLHPAPSRSDDRQLMPELLHPIAMRLDALAVLSDCQTAAPDRETVRCTLAVVWESCQGCIWCRCHQIHWRLSVDVRETASDLERSDALTICLFFEVLRLNSCLLTQTKWCWLCVENVMSSMLHSAVKRSDARWRLFNCQSCTRCQCHRMHWRNCLNFRSVKTQRLSDCENSLQSKCNVIRDEDVCWCCKLIDWLIDWLQDKFLT